MGPFRDLFDGLDAKKEDLCTYLGLNLCEILFFVTIFINYDGKLCEKFMLGRSATKNWVWLCQIPQPWTEMELNSDEIITCLKRHLISYDDFENQHYRAIINVPFPLNKIPTLGISILD